MRREKNVFTNHQRKERRPSYNMSTPSLVLLLACTHCQCHSKTVWLNTARDWRGHDWKQVWDGIRYATSHRVFYLFRSQFFFIVHSAGWEKKNRRVQLRIIKRIGQSEANSRKLRVIMARPKHSTFWLSLYLFRKEANEIKVNLRYASLHSE